MRRSFIVISFLFSSFTAFADVFIDQTIRPCDPKLAAEWVYTPVPVEAPATPKLPFTCDGDVKVFEITAEEVMSIFDNTYEPGPIYTWGYNGSNPGPVMEILEGEKVRVLFKNKLPEPSSIHWHGLDVPYQQDGVQRAIKPGGSFVYEWAAGQSGTYMYHAHMDSAKQLSMGLVGFLIIHPKKIPETMVDHDILYFLQMWALPPHSIFPDVMEMMMFNYFTMNGKSAPSIPSTTVYAGQKVRLRFANMSMMEHPMHLHGMNWRVVATGFGDNPRSTHTYGNTILVPTAQPMDVIIDDIKTPGEWMLHCHLPHHVTNNMDVDTIPGEPMYMGNGGMHTLLKVFRGPNDPGYDTSDTDGEGGSHGGGHGGGHEGMSAPKISTYDGQLKLSNGSRLDVTLELYKAQEDKEWRKAKAYLKVFLNRDEFLVYHYEQVKFNFETSLMSLEGDDKAITLSNLMYMSNDDMGMLTGDASVDFGSVSGEVSLTLRDPEMSEMRLKNDLSVSGEFESTCNSKKQSLQIVTARSLLDEEGDTNNPLAAFGIYGTLGSLEQPGLQVASIVSEGFYNPFKNSLRLQLDTAGNKSSLQCETVLKGGKVAELKCSNGCIFGKKGGIVSLGAKAAEKPIFVDDKTPVINQMTEDKKVNGTYSGLLSLSRNNEVMPFSLKIVAKRYATNSMVITQNMLSGTSAIGISDKSSISYKLKERPFLDSSSSVNNGKNLLEFKTTGKLSIVITRWSETMIFGEIYHEDFGFLGEFVTKKNTGDVSGLIKNFNEIRFVTKLDGSYSGQSWKLELYSAELEEGKGPGIFSPLHLKGKLVNASGAMTVNFVSGTYDFALGNFYLISDDDRIFKGSVNGDNLELYLVSRPTRRANYLNLLNSKLQLKRM